MLGKLSFRNAKRQAKDYIIYFITVIISVSLMFSFNSIAVSEDINELSTYMQSFSKCITGISIIIILIMSWLINYTMKFMLEKRSKEFGIYEILGIEKKSISNMFTLENLIIGSIAFLIGIGVGTFLYQIFTTIIMKLFNQPYQIGISFNLKAIWMTSIYFFGIFVLVLLNCRRKINNTKVNDLLYADKKNENSIIKKSKGNIVIFILSIILLIGALFLTNKEFKSPENMNARNVFIAIIMLIIGIYLFYISISSFIVKRYLDNKSKKYKKDNMFLFRNLTSKINTMSVTIGTIAVMFTIILIGGNVALLLNNMLSNELEMGYPYEIMISTDDGDFTKFKQYIKENAKIKDMYEYRIYNIGNLNISKAFKGTVFEGTTENELECILVLTEYNRLREILGYEKMNLQEDEIIIHSLKTAEKILEQFKQESDIITIVNKNMKIKDIKGEHLAQIGFNGYIYTIIVPDSLIPLISEEEAKLKNQVNTEEGQIKDEQEYGETNIYTFDYSYNLVVQTEEATNEKFYNDLKEFIKREHIPLIGEIDGKTEEYHMEIPHGSVQTRGERISESKSFYAIISFLAFYIALIFVMATATLLAIQQLSESEKYKYRYELLKKLGIDELQTNRIIFKQLFMYFAIPLLIPIIVSIPAIIIIGNIFTIAVTIEEILKNIAIILGMFILVYGIYFIATDIQFERNVNGN